MDSLSPNIFVKDINKTIKFYQNLGFELITTVPEEGDFVWAMMTSGNVAFMFQTFESLADELHRYGICNSPINCTITATLSA